MNHGARPLRSVWRQKFANLSGPTMAHGWYTIVRNAAGPAQVSIWDEIGFYGVSSAQFLDELSQIPGDIEVHLNSPGGDIYEGLAIYNGLLQARRRGNVGIVIDGLAASAASFIAMAASPGRLEIGPHARMMIHDGFCMAIGNAADMRSLADQLDAESDNIAGIYADRTGKPQAYWRDKMRAETWFTDRQAVAEGLADRIHGQDDSPANRWDFSVFSNFAPANASDPDHDGDDDSTAEGDTDHDYVLPDGSPGPKASPRNADKYKQEDRDRMAASGEAMPDGSYPIADAEDLDNAIHAVGRGGADHDAIRKHIIKRAEALHLSERIPDNWNSDGSLKTSSPGDAIDLGLLSAALLNALEGVNVR